MGESNQLNALQGLFSGIGHPILGPDHLLFLLAITFVGLKHPKSWILPLLAFGMGGSLLAQFIPLPDAISSWAESLASLSLAVEGLIALKLAPSAFLLPLFSLHGFLLGNTIVGSEPNPLASYFLGLFLSQGSLLLLASNFSSRIIIYLEKRGQHITSGIWIGIGIAFAWATLID